MSYDDIIKSSVVAELEAAEAGRDYCDLPDNHPVHRYPIMANHRENEAAINRLRPAYGAGVGYRKGV